MSDELSDISSDEPDRERLQETGRSLRGARPVPSPSFRGDLGRLIGAAQLVSAVTHWRAKALAAALAGALLLGVAGAGLAGSGPLAPTHLSSAPISSTTHTR